MNIDSMPTYILNNRSTIKFLHSHSMYSFSKQMTHRNLLVKWIYAHVTVLKINVV